MGCVDCQWDRCIRAQWLWQQPGLGADGHTELDLAPPYDVHIFVQETTSPRYERAFLTIRVPEELGRPLTRDDIHSSLWEGGTIEFTAGCNNGRYVALRVVAYPPS